MAEMTTTNPLLPPDNLTRALGFAQVGGETAPHIGLVGDTYTITVAGKDTNGRFCVIDMHVPPGRATSTSSRFRRDLHPARR